MQYKLNNFLDEKETVTTDPNKIQSIVMKCFKNIFEKL